MLLDGFWEMGLTMFISRQVGPGMVAVDVGANCGYYTLLLAGLVGRTGRVYAVEPNPEAVGLLRQSVDLNGFSEVTSLVEAAAGAGEEGQAILYIPNGEPKNAMVAPPGVTIPSSGTVYDVRRIAIDALFAPDDQIDFIKVDADASEEAIFAGMINTLLQARPCLVMEFNTARCREPHSLLAKLVEIYGRLHFLDDHGNAVATTLAQILNEQRGRDWLLCFGSTRPKRQIFAVEPRRKS